MHAAHNGHVHIIKRLLSAGANVEAKDVNGLTPLMVAVCCDRFSAADALLKAKANVGCSMRRGGAGLRTNSLLLRLLLAGPCAGPSIPSVLACDRAI